MKAHNGHLAKQSSPTKIIEELKNKVLQKFK